MMTEIYQKKGDSWVKVASDCPFPVGSIYISVGNVNPSTYWSGTTWSKITAGSFLMADDNGGKGAVSGEMPQHTHGLGNNGFAEIGMGWTYADNNVLVYQKGSGTVNMGGRGNVKAINGPAYTDVGVDVPNAVKTGLSGTTDEISTSSGKVIPTGTIKVVMWERTA